MTMIKSAFFRSWYQLRSRTSRGSSHICYSALVFRLGWIEEEIDDSPGSARKTYLGDLPKEDNIRFDQTPTFPPVVLLGTSHHLTSAYTSLEDILCGY